MEDLRNLDLDKIYKELTACKSEYMDNERYYIGDNTHIAEREPQRKPDNRVPTSFIRNLVDTMTGYAAKPGNIRQGFDDETTEQMDSQDSDFVRNMGYINEQNDEELYTAEQYEEVCLQGKSFEVFYTMPAEDGDDLSVVPYFIQVSKDNFYPVYSDRANKNLVGGIWYRMVGEDVLATVYDKEETTDYIKKKGGGTFSLATYEDRENPLPNPYGIALCNEYTGNRRGEPFWRHVKSLVDAHDESANKALNELERFSNAILLLADKVGPEFVEKLRNLNIIDGLGDNPAGMKPSYLERNLDDSFFRFLTEHYDGLIYRMAGVVNMADENFAQNASGVAIKYKLQGMEYQASRIDAYFDKGLKRRFEIIKAILTIDPKVSNAQDYKVIIKHDRTLPPDLITLAQATRGLIGTISQESILKLFPKTVVADVEKEMQLLAEETGSFGVENG